MRNRTLISRAMFPNIKTNRTIGSTVAKPIQSLKPLVSDFNRLLHSSRTRGKPSLIDSINFSNLVNAYYYLILTITYALRPLGPATNISICESSGLIFIAQKDSALFDELHTLPLTNIVSDQYSEITRFKQFLENNFENTETTLSNLKIEAPFIIKAQEDHRSCSLQPLHSDLFLKFVHSHPAIKYQFTRHNEIRHIIINEIYKTIPKEYSQELIQHNSYNYELWNKWSTASIPAYLSVSEKLNQLAINLGVKTWKTIK